jgi:hypothetical protein
MSVGGRGNEVDRHARIVSHDPRVMPWSDDVGVTRPEVEFGAVVHADVKVP